MSTYTFYDASITVAKEAIESLESILKKASQTPKAASLPNDRIVEDMLPLSFQVHFATDLVQSFVAHSTGTEPLTFENNLKTFDEFFARIKTVQELLAKADKETVNKRVDESVTINLGPSKQATMLVRNYLSGFVVPNLFFHVTTAYNIIRKEGIALGKMDYIAPFIVKYLGA